MKLTILGFGLFLLSVVFGSLIWNTTWVTWGKIMMIIFLDLGLLLSFIGVILED